MGWVVLLAALPNIFAGQAVSPMGPPLLKMPVYLPISVSIVMVDDWLFLHFISALSASV